MRDLLVTGTDTGVGKTMIAAGLVTALLRRGFRAIGFKPVETGVDPQVTTDAEYLAHAAGVDEPLAAPLVSLSEPLAPAVAAERAGVHIEPAAIVRRIDALRDRGYHVVVEGAGGILVPLAWGYTAADLARECGLDAVVVGRAGLGTLNHVALTVESLRAREVSIRLVILNGRRSAPDVAEATNLQALARIIPGVPLFEIPFFPEGNSVTPISRLLEPLVR